ncbi:11_t:CDS:2, partial [Gigaspora margarita]
ITYASIIDTRKPECKFDITGIPICTPHCMITVYVNHTPKKTEEFIYFGANCVEYNSVTGSSNIKIEITILYDSQSEIFLDEYEKSMGENEEQKDKEQSKKRK